MARLQTGTTNYQGVLYDLNKTQGSQTVYDLSTNGVGTTGYREPSLVTGNNEDTFAEIEKVSGLSYDNGKDSTATNQYYKLAGFNSIQEFGKDMQDEYNNMIESVDKYKGFYVGRYETGIENGKAVSKNAYTNQSVTTADPTQNEIKYWYGLYNKQRTMAADNNYIGVESSMILGSQYDAMMNWMIKTGTVVGVGYDDSKWTSGMIITGQSEKDIINKVHDLYGCHIEWTLEANSNNYRVTRGSSSTYSRGSAPSYGYTLFPNHIYSEYSSRLTLYIELS